MYIHLGIATPLLTISNAPKGNTLKRFQNEFTQNISTLIFFHHQNKLHTMYRMKRKKKFLFPKNNFSIGLGKVNKYLQQLQESHLTF